MAEIPQNVLRVRTGHGVIWSGSESNSLRKRSMQRKRRHANGRQQRLENARQPRSVNASISSSAHGQRPS
jgi:hypothetical protein